MIPNKAFGAIKTDSSYLFSEVKKMSWLPLTMIDRNKLINKSVENSFVSSWGTVSD